MARVVLLLLAATLALAAETNVVPRESPEVVTNSGRVKGAVVPATKGKVYHAFYSIPYAKPPVGQLRFKPPQPVDKWNDVHDATKPGPMCIQADKNDYKKMVGQEDCLHLNVYTNALVNGKKNLPVIVWIHPGNWMQGASGPMYNNPMYLMDKDVILVTMNYRMGPLGFLSTGDEVVPGNNGMKDQVMALKWVQKNIASFGGNPNAVTIMGHESSAVDVSMHMISPMSKGLFHRAISQSGTAMCPWATIPTPKSQTTKLAMLLNCPRPHNSQEVLKCLQQVDVKKMVEQYPEFMGWEKVVPKTMFGPTVEKTGTERFLPEEPSQMMKKGAINHVPWMVGKAENEAMDLVLDLMKNNDVTPLRQLDEQAYYYFPMSMYYKGQTPDDDFVTGALRHIYFGDETAVDEKHMDILRKMYDDMLYGHCTYETVKQMVTHKRDNPVYVYMYDYYGKTGRDAAWYNTTRDESGKPVKGTTEEMMSFIFPNERRVLEGEMEKAMSRMIINFIVNFATYSDPTPAAMQDNLIQWQPVHEECFKYMRINEQTGMMVSFPHTRMHKLNKLPLPINIGRDQCKFGAEWAKEITGRQ